MKIRESLEFSFKSPENAMIFYKSFIPELEKIPLKRSKLEIDKPKMESNNVFIRIFADDAIAYRANINSLIIFANSVEKALSLVDEF